MNILNVYESMEYGPAPESDAPAMAWLAERDRKFSHFINGEFAKPTNLFKTRNPATGEPLAHVSAGTKKDVDSAVKAAKTAQPDWEKAGGPARARFLYALARLVQKHGRLLAILETLDNGKPIRESRDIDIPLVARHFYHHAGWAQIIGTEFPDQKAAGVVGQIIPWNFPLLMLAWKIAPALAAGNTVVLKPAEYTPLTALCFAELCQMAGLPKGVVNIVTGDGETGALIAGHPDIGKIAFTGSSEVGRIIRQQTAGQGKKLTLELGGKSPFIVFEDADIDSAIEGLVDAIWFNQGQVCCAGSRLLMHEGIADVMLEKIKARMDRLRVGDPLDKSTDMGAIIDPVQRDRIEELVKEGVKEGASLYQTICPKTNHGCFYPPTLLYEAEPAMRVVQEEIFGPVLVAMTFRTPSEAVELANNTRYGLAASIWTENINLALDIAPKVKAGVIWVNSTNMFDAAAGFGGYRESGYGREGGREGIFEYMLPVSLPNSESEKARPSSAATRLPPLSPDAVDRTRKLYIGGKQMRPDSGYDHAIFNKDNELVGQVGEGNRKDIRNAVQAAANASVWSDMTGHARGQILYFIAENLSARSEEFANTLHAMTGASGAMREVDASIDRLFTYAAWADKYDGAVHQVPIRGVALAMNEPIGVIGISCPDESPLLSFVSLVAPAIALGNRVVALPSEAFPLAAIDLYQVLETSDLPGGVLNIVTGTHEPLVKTLAKHAGIDAIWHFADAAQVACVERNSVSNLKQTWVSGVTSRDWYRPRQGEQREFLQRATQVKNIWIPYGE
jgi:aldehyde dehydrogenase (NAD+)